MTLRSLELQRVLFGVSLLLCYSIASSSVSVERYAPRSHENGVAGERNDGGLSDGRTPRSPHSMATMSLARALHSWHFWLLFPTILVFVLHLLQHWISVGYETSI